MEASIIELVQDSDKIREALDPVIDHLPSSLRRALRQVAHLTYHRKAILEASARIAARRGQSTLKAEIAKQCDYVKGTKTRLDDDNTKTRLDFELHALGARETELVDEITDLQQKLSSLREESTAKREGLEKLEEEKSTVATTLQLGLAEIQKMSSGLVSGTD